MDRVVPPEIESSLKRFDSQSTLLQTVYVILGIIAITAPIVVAVMTDLLGVPMTRAFSLGGAVAVGLIAGFRLSRRGNEMRRAYLDLRAAIIKYKYDQTTGITELVEAYLRINRSIGTIEGPDSKHDDGTAKKLGLP